MNDALALAAFWTGLATGAAGFCALVGANQTVTRLTQKLDGERAARRVVEAALRAEQRAHTCSRVHIQVDANTEQMLAALAQAESDRADWLRPKGWTA